MLGRPPADKYLTGYEQTLGALAAVCQAPLPAARTLLAHMVFAYLSGNGDAHAKNDFGSRDFVALGSALGLPEKATRKLVREQAERTDAWLPLLAALPFETGKVHKLASLQDQRPEAQGEAASCRSCLQFV